MKPLATIKTCESAEWPNRTMHRSGCGCLLLLPLHAFPFLPLLPTLLRSSTCSIPSFRPSYPPLALLPLTSFLPLLLPLCSYLSFSLSSPIFLPFLLDYFPFFSLLRSPFLLCFKPSFSSLFLPPLIFFFFILFLFLPSRFLPFSTLPFLFPLFPLLPILYPPPSFPCS